MRTRSVASLVIVAILLIGAVLARHPKKSSSATTPTATPTSATSPSSNASAITPTMSSDVSVAITNNSFTPASITIKKGQGVTWKNDDAIQHSVIQSGNGGPNSTLIGHNGSYTYTFLSTGTFTYHCGVHPNMSGTVIVTN